jgi:hypothetical protein
MVTQGGMVGSASVLLDSSLDFSFGPTVCENLGKPCKYSGLDSFISKDNDKVMRIK